MENDNKVVLNVGGQRFETNKAVLKKIPATRLSRLTEALGNYDRVLNEYFFDRHPGVFSQILNYYRTGKLHYPTNVCGPLFEAELEFWGLDSNQVEPCCWKTYTKHRDTEETLATLERLALDDEKTSSEELAKMFGFEEEFNEYMRGGQLPWYKKTKPIVWQLFNEPYSSQTAKTLTYISIFFIVLSILTYCLSTVNWFCQSTLFCQAYTAEVEVMKELGRYSMIKLHFSSREKAPTILDYIEYVCITWFTFEFGIKFFVAPNKLKFLKSILNWIDLIAIIWFYADLVYNYFLFHHNSDTHPAWDLFGTVRIMRLFKLFNHYPGLKIIMASLRASAGVLRLLVFFIGCGVIIFASLIFYAEKLTGGSDGRNGMSSIVGTSHENNQAQEGNENQFNSIIEAIWFSIASLTTVGFGDICPKTPMGMVFGAISTVAGVLMIDLPMPIIVSNFANYYKHLQARSKFPSKLRRRVLPMDGPRIRASQSTRFHSSLHSNRQQQPIIQNSVNKATEMALITTYNRNLVETKVNNNPDEPDEKKSKFV